MSRKITAAEVAKHNKADDCWIIVHNKVYDVTPFLADHPGGKKVLVNEAGKEASKKFDMFHKADVLTKYGANLVVGELDTSDSTGAAAAAPAAAAAAPRSSAAAAAAAPAAAAAGSVKRDYKLINVPKASLFGELVPYGDPAWYQGWQSPYYTASHKAFRAALRDFVDTEIVPHCHDWDEARAMPRDFHKKCFQAGWLPGVLGGKWLVEHAGTNIIGGVKPEEWDVFHELILTDEVSRCGSGGVLWALFGGLSIGLPPVVRFGSKFLVDKVVKPCVTGEKVICLAITEPSAGSDVANIRTSAEKTPDGKHYIVNGEKKWITNGVFADFFTVAVRTGGAGMGGISLLLIEKEFAGVTTRQMKCSGVWPSGTTYITFEDVKVPVENLIGLENNGFKYIMSNFNHERWGICVQSIRFARVCLEDSIRYAHKRMTFGKRLIDHPIIRDKIARMAGRIEGPQNWLENITYQFKVLPHDQHDVLGGSIAGLKAASTLAFELCAREAQQVFGGLGVTRGGQGERVERLSREVRSYAVPGGSEEIMQDLSIRQAIKVAAQVAKM